MKNFKEYIVEHEEKKWLDELNEDILTAAIKTLGVTSIVALAAWGGSLLLVKSVKLVDKVIDNLKRTIKTIRSFGKKDVESIINKIKQDPNVKRQKDKTETAINKFEDDLYQIYTKIENKNWSAARNEFLNLPKDIRNNPDVRKIIITKTTKELKEPPLYVTSPGNKTYQAIKKIIDISTARAAATATRMALDKNLNKN